MNNWPTVPFGEILRPNKRAYRLGPTEDADLVGMRLYGEGPFHRERKPALQIKKKSHFIIKTNDVIYNKLFAWKGTFGVVPPELDGMFVSDKFPTYEADSSRIDLGYLRWFFRYPPLWDQAKDYSKGAAALSKLTLNPPYFAKLIIPLPPLAEQLRLVERIDALAAKIEEAKRLRTEADKAITALGLAPYRLIPQQNDSRESRPLAEVIENHDSGWSPQCDDCPAKTGEWGVLKTTSVQWEGFDAQQNKALLAPMLPRPEITVEAGDVLITRAGPVNRVGVACYVPQSYPRLMLSDKIVRLRPKPQLAAEYLVAFLATPQAQDYFRQGKTGLAASQVNISREKLLGVPIVIPPAEEQQRLIVYIRSFRVRLQAAIKAQQPVTRELDGLLPAILDRAFKGQL